MSSTPLANRERYGVVLIAVAFLLMSVNFIPAAPLWDGTLYDSRCIQPFARGSFSFFYSNCLGHISSLCMAPVVVMQQLMPGSSVALLFPQLVVGVLMIFEVHRLFCSPYFSGFDARMRLLATSILAVHPLLIASAINLTCDFNVTAWFVIGVSLILRERMVPALLALTMLALSKEHGTALAAGLFSIVLALKLFRPNRDDRNQGPTIVLWLVLASAGLLIVSYGVLNLWLPPSSRWYHAPNWFSGHFVHSLKTVLFTFRIRPVVVARFVTMFALHFGWIPIAFLAARILTALVRRRMVAYPITCMRAPSSLLAIFFVAVTLVVVRWPGFVMPRFFVWAQFIIWLAGFGALAALSRSCRLKCALLLGSLVATFSSNFAALDPVSRRYFGTFAFGSHRELDMTSNYLPLPVSCCGYGRDQLVHNLEYLRLNELLEVVYADLRPGPNNMFAVPDGGEFGFTHGRWNLKTLSRTVSASDETIALPWLPWERRLVAIRPLPSHVYWIDWPNFRHRSRSPEMQRLYTPLNSRVYERSGYRLEVIEFALRPSSY